MFYSHFTALSNLPSILRNGITPEFTAGYHLPRVYLIKSSCLKSRMWAMSHTYDKFGVSEKIVEFFVMDTKIFLLRAFNPGINFPGYPPIEIYVSNKTLNPLTFSIHGEYIAGKSPQLEPIGDL